MGVVLLWRGRLGGGFEEGRMGLVLKAEGNAFLLMEKVLCVKA